MVTNKFFDTTPPPGDPGNTDPADRPFLNFTRRQRTANSTLPIMPVQPTANMANQLGQTYERPPQPPPPVAPGLGPAPDYSPPNMRPATDPAIIRNYPEGAAEYAPEFDTFQVNKDAQQQASTFQEIRSAKQIFNQVSNIIQTEKVNLPQNKFTELTTIADKYLSQTAGYNSIDPYEAGTLAMDEVFIALGRMKPERVRDKNANVLWKDTWQNILSTNAKRTEQFGSFGGELAFNEFRQVEALRNAPRAVAETIFLTSGLKMTGSIVKSVLAKNPVKQIGAIKNAYQNKGFWGTVRPKNWLTYSNVSKALKFEMAEERYLIPYSTGLVQQGYRKAGLFNPEEERLFEEAMIAHRANFGDSLADNIMSTISMPFLVNTTNPHSSIKPFLENNITGTEFLGIDVEPGEVLGFLIGTGIIGIPLEIGQNAIRRILRGGARNTIELANNKNFIPNGRMSELPEDIRQRYLSEELPKYVYKVERTFGNAGVQDLPNQLSNVHKSDTRIINTPEATYANITDPQMPQNKKILDDINRVFDDLPEMTPVQRQEYLSNPIVRMHTNWQNTIYWNTHQNAKNEIIDTSHKLIKPLKETRTELSHRVAIGEDPMGKISQEHLSGFGRTADVKYRALGADLINALGYQRASDEGMKGGEGHKLELNNIRTDRYETEVNDINDRTFHSYEEPETDYQMMAGPVVSNSFDAIDALRIRLNVDLDIVDDVAVRKNFNKTLKANALYNSWLQEYQNIIRKKINAGTISKTDPKVTFDAALRQNGLYDLINPKNNTEVKFSEIYDLVRRNMISYEVRINDSTFFKDDGTVLLKHKFSKPKYINGKANYYSKSAWIKENDEGLFDVYNITNTAKIKKISVEQTAEDARQFADEYFVNVIPNSLVGEMVMSDSRLKRSRTYNMYNTLGAADTPNDEKILNLVHNHESYGIYQTMTELIQKYPDANLDELFDITDPANTFAGAGKYMSQDEIANYVAEVEKHKFLRGHSNSLEMHFHGADADGLGWARIKTVKQADGTDAISVSEIQSWKSSRVKDTDRVDAAKIKEWREFEDMTNEYLVRNSAVIKLETQVRQAEISNSDDLQKLRLELNNARADRNNYKNTVMWDHASKNNFWKNTLPEDSIQGMVYEKLDNTTARRKDKRRNIVVYLAQRKYDHRFDSAEQMNKKHPMAGTSLREFREILKKDFGLSNKKITDIEMGRLPNIQIPWVDGYMKLAPDAPRLNEKTFNQMMAKMIMEYARNNNITRILFDDSVSAVGSSIGLSPIDMNYIHRGDINGILYTKYNPVPRTEETSFDDLIMEETFVNEPLYEIIPLGLNKFNSFKTISNKDFDELADLQNVRNGLSDPTLNNFYNLEEGQKMKRLLAKHTYKSNMSEFIGDSPNDMLSKYMQYLKRIHQSDADAYTRMDPPKITWSQVKELFGGDIADALKTDEMARSNNVIRGKLMGAINFGKFKEGTDLSATSNVRKRLEGANQKHYSKIIYKTNFSSEATNANSYVDVTKDSVPYFLKKQFDDLNYKGGLYEGVKTELVTTKYNVASRTPIIYKGEKEFIDPFADNALTAKPLHNDEDILSMFKAYQNKKLEEGPGSSKHMEIVGDIINEMENSLKLLYKEFPERNNTSISRKTPSQEYYTKAMSNGIKKYVYTNESIKDLMKDLDNSIKVDDLDDMYAQAQYNANQDAFLYEDDPFYTPEPEPLEADFKFIYSLGSRNQTLDAITLELDGKPLTMLDIENITDFEVFRKTKSGVKASVQFFNDGKTVVNSYKNANIADMFHEIGHLTVPKLKSFLDPDEYDNVLKYYNVKDGKWTRKNHEKFADDFMDYLSNPDSGFWKDASKSKIRRGFEYLISFFKRLFGFTLNEHTGLSPEVKRFVYAVHKKVPDAGFSKFEKELGFPIDPESKQIIDRIEASHARKIAKIEKVENKLKERLSPESDGKGKKPDEPYVDEYEDGDDSYKILYNHFLPSHEETRTVGLMRQLEGARNSIISRNEQWVKDTQKAVYKKYKINPNNLTTNFDSYGDPNDTLDLYAALHGERLVTDPKLITANMQVINVGNRQYGIRTPLSPSEARDSLTEPWKRDMYNRVTVLRLEEEIEMLDFLSDTFRAVDDKTWDTVRLGFNAEIFFEKMMGIPNYFPRLWQDKAGKKIVSGRRVAGPPPDFSKGRVNRTFIEMLVDNPEAGYEGLLPSTPDPASMMASRKIYGSSWREMQVMMNTLNKFGLMKTKNDLLDQGLDPKEIQKQWEVPKIGPTFEGMLVPSGKADVAFTPEIYVPRNVSTFLNNIFDADPPVPMLDEANTINMFGKQIKVAFAPLQHIDMYYRGLGSSTAGAVFETFVPSNLTNPKRVAQGIYRGITTPISLASDILLSNLPVTGKIWRNKLAKQLVSDKPVNPVLKGSAGEVTFRMLEEQGAGVKGDRGIISSVNRNIEEFRKANPTLFDKFGPKRLTKELSNLNNFFQGGLFEGTYRYAQISAIKNYVLPYSARVNKDFTPQQHAAWAATYSNTQFSTLGLFQEWIKGANAQKAFNLAIFSRIENTALLNQGIEMLGMRFLRPEPGAKGLKKIPIKMSKKRSAFFIKNFLGFYISFWIIGNLQNSGAEIFKHGPPKDMDDYVDNYLMKDDQLLPLQKSINEDSFLPYEYNSKFMAPKAGYFGRNGLPVYVDQVGQMDTIFRWMSPIDALWGRTGVPIQTIKRQVDKETFFGQPFEGKYMWLTQLIADTSLPWMAQNALNLSAQKYPKMQQYVATSEKRLGTKGVMGQFFVNFRAMNNEQVKQYALDQYKKEFVTPQDTFLGSMPDKWSFLNRKQREDILNAYPNIRAELKLREEEQPALDRFQANPEIEKGVALNTFTARLENDRTAKQIGVINEFVNDLGRFGSEAFLTAQLLRGSDVEYRKLEILKDELKALDNDFYAGKEAVKIFLKLEDYEPDDADENTQAMTEYYENMKRFTSEESGIFMIEDWLDFRDNKFYPSLTEGQRSWIEDNFAPSNVPYLDEYNDWIAEGYELGIPRQYFEVKAFWQDKLKELLELREQLPSEKYID